MLADLSRSQRWEMIRARAEEIVTRSNPHHEPAGSPEGGQFAPGDEDGGDGDTEQKEARRAADEKQFQTEKLITDGPREGTSRAGVVKDKYIAYWGGSHSVSSAMTGYAAKVMDIGGYQEKYPTEEVTALADKFIAEINNSYGSSEPLYHGFKNVGDTKFKSGDTLKLPLLASTGDMSHAMGYGINYRLEDNSKAAVFEFPKGVSYAGYSRWDREKTKEFGHTWGEAIVAGEFEVVGTRVEHESGWQKLPVEVVTLKPIGVFDPASNKWRKM